MSLLNRPLILWFGAIICFFVLPIFLIDSGTSHLLRHRAQSQKNVAFNKLEQKIDSVAHYNSGTHYYHSVLKRTFEIAQKQPQPFEYLELAIAHLKQKHPDRFRFIVWDSDGKRIDRLSDEKGFRYIVNLLYQVFSELTLSAKENHVVNPYSIDLISQRLTILRSYLGDFFIVGDMSYPLLPGTLGQPVFSSTEPEKGYFWFKVAEQFSMFAHLHDELINSSDHMLRLLDNLNETSDDKIIMGLSDLFSPSKSMTSLEVPAEILIELAGYDNISQTNVETSNYLLYVRNIGSSSRIFAFVSKRDFLTDVDTFRLIVFVASLSFFFYLNLKIFRPFSDKSSSISIKLIFLFAVANGMPLLVLGFMGHAYIQQERARLLEEKQQQINEMIVVFDGEFEKIKFDYASQLNNLVDSLSSVIDEKKLSEAKLKPLKDLVVSLNAYEFFVIDEEGNVITSSVIHRRGTSFIRNSASNILDFVNSANMVDQLRFEGESEGRDQSGQILTESLIGGELIIIDRILSFFRKIQEQQMGHESRMYYWNILGTRGNYSALVLASWEKEVIQEQYIRNNLSRLQYDDYKFFSMIESNGVTYPDITDGEDYLHSLYRQIFDLSYTVCDAVEYQSGRYIAFGMIGANLDNAGILGMYPIDEINQQITALTFRLVVFGVISILMAYAIAQILSRLFMKPLAEIHKGVVEIGQQNFKHRVTVESSDELGLLSDVFNDAIESLSQLQIAQIVQESLFPQKNLLHNSFEVLGKNVSMTRLSGDYYDYFKIDESNIAVLIGDVAGHGVPAAISMSLAKGTILMSGDEKKDSKDLLHTINRVLTDSKKRKGKPRMFTCQYFCINSVTGDITFSNAGHCFPVVLSDGKATSINLIGTPLGIKKKVVLSKERIHLKKGDILFLYTDGIIEATNERGEQFGLERLERMLEKNFTQELNTFYKRIVDELLLWSDKSDDDITMVLVKHF